MVAMHLPFQTMSSEPKDANEVMKARDTARPLNYKSFIFDPAILLSISLWYCNILSRIARVHAVILFSAKEVVQERRGKTKGRTEYLSSAVLIT